MLSQAHLLQDTRADSHCWAQAAITLLEALHSVGHFPIRLRNSGLEECFWVLHESFLQDTGHALTNSHAARYLS